MVWVGIDYRLESGTKAPPFLEERLHVGDPEVDLFQAFLRRSDSSVIHSKSTANFDIYSWPKLVMTQTCGQKERARVRG